MRKIVATLMLVLLTTGLVVGQTPAIKAQLNTGDAEKIKEGLILLQQALGVGQQTTEAITQPQQKSMADVMDKLLEMMKNTVASLSEVIKNVAPEVWRIMIRQQYAKALGNLVLPWGLLTAILIYTLLTKKLWKWKEEYTDSRITDGYSDDFLFTERGWRGFFTTFIPLIVGLICVIWGLNKLNESVLYLINPEYYALRDLLMLLVNPAAM